MPADLVDVDEFTDPVTVPEAGDDRTAASIVPAFQALLNRTRNLKNLLTGAGAVDVEIASGTSLVMKGSEGLRYDVLKFRTISHPVGTINRTTVGVALNSVDPTVEATYPGCVAFPYPGVGRLSFKLPQGSLLYHVRLGFKNIASNSFTAKAFQVRDAVTPPFLPVSTEVAALTVTASGTTEIDLDCTALSVPTSSSDNFHVEVQSGVAGQMLLCMFIDFGDPGPRNF